MRDRNTEAWAGTVDVGGRTEFLMLRRNADGSMSADLPHRLLFARQVEERADGFSVAVPDRRIHVTLAAADGAGKPAARPDHVDGPFALARVSAMSPTRFRQFIGDWRTASGRHITLSVLNDVLVPEPVYFYFDGDAIVRLYPLSDHEFMSEQSDHILIDVDASGRHRLTWRDGSGAETTAELDRWYEEEDVTIKGKGGALAGTLLLPPSSPPHPAIVFMHGTAPSERDFYRVFARQFLHEGFACLLFDKRGAGASGGDPGSSVYDRADDGEAALDHLLTDERIASAKVGLWALSNAGWSAPMVAAHRREVAFMITIGCSGVSQATVETFRKTWSLRERGLSEPVLADVGEAWESGYRYLATGSISREERDRLDGILQRLAATPELQRVPVHHYAEVHPVFSPIPPWKGIDDLERQSRDGWEDMLFDPIHAYRAMTCPLLYLIGELDRNIPPQASVSSIDAALAAAGNDDYELRIVPGAGHLLNVIDDSIVGETTEGQVLGLHDFRFAPGILSDMRRWAAAHRE